MYQDDPDLDQRLSRFEAQLDRFSLAIHQWQDSQAHEASAPHHVDTREFDQRIKALEETFDREAQALRRMHEEPLRELQAHAANLKEICAAAASSVSGLDQAESRLSAIQTDVHQHLSDLSRSLQSLVADLRLSTSTALAAQGPTASWPLDRVVQMHDELRRGTNSSSAQPAADGTTAPPGLRLLERAATGEPDTPGSSTRVRRSWYIGGAVAAAVAVLLVLVLERRIETRLNDAGARVEAAQREATAATRFANQQVLAARQEANKQITEARESAQRAETVGAVLTAPDLIRFNLSSGVAVDRSSAQLLWSRTRGLVLSASRLPAAPPETIYQLWLKTNAEPVSAGVFVPDATGRATLVLDVPPKIMGPVLGAEVTIEPNGGRTTPSGRTLLVRLPQG